MFHTASLKLAALYLAIIMFISLFFSANIYQLSLNELDRSLRRPEIQNRLPGGVSRALEKALLNELSQQYEEARNRVINRLILINLLILIAGGFLSYYLAERTLKPIEEAHESLERFTADASHELRTPIAAMRSETEVALMNPKLTLAQAKKLLESNIEELTKLTTLSEGLLNLAQLKNTPFNKQTIVVSEVVASALNRVLPLAESKNILIHSPKEAGLKIAADADSLSEALVILLDNAIKYSPEKSEITVSASSNSKQVNIAVADQGIGIKASEQPYIFERFYRADVSRTQLDHHGYGIGLAIAKDITARHNGTISVKSTPGKGSTFTLSLPKA
jgi:two-component system sensor histidine kinase CiaH